MDAGFTGFTVWDRDLSGQIVSSHNNSLPGGAVGFGVWKPADPYVRGCAPVTGQPAPWSDGSTNFHGPITFAGGTSTGSITNLVGRGGLIAEPRSDGIFDGYNSIQGVRTYDSQQNAWTTPDAYPGSMTDPESQRPYVWNGNDSVAYGDPSGYYPGIGNQGGGTLLFDPYSEGSFVQNSASTRNEIAAYQAYMTLVPAGFFDSATDTCYCGSRTPTVGITLTTLSHQVVLAGTGAQGSGYWTMFTSHGIDPTEYDTPSWVKFVWHNPEYDPEKGVEDLSLVLFFGYVAERSYANNDSSGTAIALIAAAVAFDQAQTHLQQNLEYTIPASRYPLFMGY